ncbi:MAG: hypothetical protein LQ345_002170 [Seirophora villosa]|nr:MAG: hypothetical protein LQ345_002170 [Seirophora villosa]
MNGRSSLIPLLRQLRPRPHIYTSTPLPRPQLTINRTASSIKSTSAFTVRNRHQPKTLCCAPDHRFLHTSPPSPSSPPASVPTTDPSTTPPQQQQQPPTPQYQLTFTCKPCAHRSTHTISKHGYEKGTVLVACPQCKNRHLVSDHLKIFSDKRITLEEIMREKGELLRRGRVGMGGEDVEFYPPEEEATRVGKEER